MDYITIETAAETTGLSERIILRLVKKVLEGRYPIDNISTDVKGNKHLWVIKKEFLNEYFNVGGENALQPGLIVHDMDEQDTTMEFLLSRIDMKNDQIAALNTELESAKKRLQSARSRQMILATPSRDIFAVKKVDSSRQFRKNVYRFAMAAAVFFFAFALGQMVGVIGGQEGVDESIAKSDDKQKKWTLPGDSIKASKPKQVAND